MELFENIRLKIGKFLLAKKGIQRLREENIIQIFSDVRKIGIVWDTSKPK